MANLFEVLKRMSFNAEQEGVTDTFAQTALQQRFQPNMEDATTGIFNTNQAFAQPNLYGKQPLNAQMAAQERMKSELAPLAMELELQGSGQKLQQDMASFPLEMEFKQSQINANNALSNMRSSGGGGGSNLGKTQFERLSNMLMQYDERINSGEKLSLPEQQQYNLIRQQLDKVGSAVDKQRLLGANQQATSNQNIGQILDSAEALIQQGTLGNSLGDRARLYGAKNLGIGSGDPEVIRTKALMDMGNQLVLARGSLGTGVSTADAARYDSAAGDFSSAQSNPQRLQSIKVMREIANKYINQANTYNQQYQQMGELPLYGLGNTPGNAPVPLPPMDTPAGVEGLTPEEEMELQMLRQRFGK